MPAPCVRYGLRPARRPGTTGRSRSWLGLLVLAACVLGPVPAGAAARAPAESRHGMVVSAEAHATRAGVEMLERGGNAVDAAVAVAFALGVTEPYHSGIGGGGFLLARLEDGSVVALDMRETAPAAATPDMYLRPGVPDDASRVGGLAVATPGTVAGLALALERWGKLSWPEVLAPAIRLAEEGFEIGPRHARVLERWRALGLAERFPDTARIQLPPEGVPIEAGWRLVQPDLARTLRQLAREGPDAFYRGPLARAIAEAVQAHGGILTEEDLAAYAPRLREPVRGTYRGLEVVSFPPPSSGGVALIEMLNILEGFDMASLGAGSSAAIHRATEAMKLAFADRAMWLGDPDFVEVPVAGLVSKAYAAELRRRIDPPWWRRAPWTWPRRERASRVERAGVPPGAPTFDGGTTHLSVTDARGNAVALTQTINLLFGSGITVPGTGIVLNNEMDDFSVAPGTPNAFGLVDVRGANAVAPGKRPLSSMTPTIVLEDGEPRIVAGSPGGPRIITTVLNVLLHLIDWDWDVSAAVAAPRYHHQWVPDALYLEPEHPRDVVEALRCRGHRVEIPGRHWSSAQAIEIDRATGRHLGGSDPRSDGLAQGPRPR